MPKCLTAAVYLFAWRNALIWHMHNCDNLVVCSPWYFQLLPSLATSGATGIAPRLCRGTAASTIKLVCIEPYMKSYTLVASTSVTLQTAASRATKSDARTQQSGSVEVQTTSTFCFPGIGNHLTACGSHAALTCVQPRCCPSGAISTTCPDISGSPLCFNDS